MLSAILIILFGFVIGFFSSHVQYFVYKFNGNLSVINRRSGYHFHHSMIGVVLYFLPSVLHLASGQILFLYSLATAIIIDHTMKEGFIFITRESEDMLTYWFLSRHFLLLQLPQDDGITLLQSALGQV
jgi:hypothetical protein